MDDFKNLIDDGYQYYIEPDNEGVYRLYVSRFSRANPGFQQGGYAEWPDYAGNSEEDVLKKLGEYDG